VGGSRDFSGLWLGQHNLHLMWDASFGMLIICFIKICIVVYRI
jgi:hypothetical protein